MFRIAAFFIGFISLIFSISTQAQEENWFEVEVYVFSRHANDTEKWPDTVSLADTRNSIDLISPVIANQSHTADASLENCTTSDWATRPDWCNQQLLLAEKTQPSKIPVTIAATTEQYAKPGEQAVLLAESQSKFNELISKITQESGVQSLLHMTWQENMLPRSQARPIRLYAGRNFASEYDENGLLIDTNNKYIKHFQVLSDYLDKAPLWQLDGIINIYLNHWLYIETNLVLRDEGTKTLPNTPMSYTNNYLDSYTSDDSTALPNPTIPFLYAIHIKQNRRVRSDEIHYFDHPKLGMLIQIRKMQQPNVAH